MPVYIEMPKLSDTMTEGTLVKWHKKPGDNVEIGDVLAEIETDKATMEMEAFDEGVLSEVYVQEGGKAAIGEKLAALLAPGQKMGEAAEKTAPKKTQKAVEPKAEAKSKAPAATSSATEAKPASGGRVKASPLAKKIAAEGGLDLTKI